MINMRIKRKKIMKGKKMVGVNRNRIIDGRNIKQSRVKQAIRYITNQN